jgi:hypothetical protein
MELSHDAQETIAEIVSSEIETPLENAIEDAVTEAVQGAIAELAVEIAIQAADDAALSDAILAEEFRAWQAQSEGLLALQNEKIAALETTLANLLATTTALQLQLADYQAALLIPIAQPIPAPVTPSIRTPHTEESQMELPENAAGGNPAKPKAKEKPAPARRKVLWG